MALRYAVGIDLGTSNTALAYADLGAADPGAAVQVFQVPQLVASGEVAGRPLLPSHLYLPGEHELSAGALALPWDPMDPAAAGAGPIAAGPTAADSTAADPTAAGSRRAAVGAFARDQGARVPGRHVASAKSWLSHPSVDRTAAILPWGAPPEVPRLSPVEASARILSHLRAAWDAAHPDAPLAEQDVALTVPASFDEGARALTLKAARDSGLPKLHLLEEPQAAFYDWTRCHRESLAAALGGARIVLVVDVGGGTTDLTLIHASVPAEGSQEAPVLRRLAVGDHLLLGGDNMDIALARKAEGSLGAKLDPGQYGALVQAARAAKELLLSVKSPEQTSVAVPGRGSRLIGGTLSAQLGRDEARALLLDGFFPAVEASAAPARASRTAGLAELGLPYAADPAITRHVAAFLQRHVRTVAEALHGPQAAGAPPAGSVPSAAVPATATAPIVDAVLYNGGALAPALLADRLTAIIDSWRAPGLPPLIRLQNDAPDLAVARGAAYYGLVRRGLGLRIGGGSPRTYYVGVGGGASAQAVCVVPRGAAEGQELEVPERRFGLVLGTPVRFRLFAASEYRPDKPGDLVAASDEGLAELPPLQTVVEGQGTAQVALKAALTEIGTLELWAAASADARWKLEFQLRGSGARSDEHAVTGALPKTIEQARELIALVYGKKAQPVAGRDVKDLWRNLEKTLGDRAGWTAATSRDLWGTLWAGAQKRRRTADHERLFFALAGFTLRPGFGAPLDGWRVEQSFGLFGPGLQHHKEAAVWAAWWIFWRRLAAGLGEAEHRALFEAIAPHLRPPEAKRVANPGKKPPGLAVDEMVRLLGALERLPVATKVEAGAWLLHRVRSGQPAGALWALGRLGARVPVAGAAHHAVPPEIASAWIEELLLLDFKQHDDAAFAVAQIGRVSGDRARDLDEPLRLRAADRLARAGAEQQARSVREALHLSEREEQRVFGESLPLGLHLA